MEEGRPDGFRARLIHASTPWATSSPAVQIVTAGLEDTLQVVRAWLTALEAGQDAPITGRARGDARVTRGPDIGGTP
jgi:hypothetical protein